MKALPSCRCEPVNTTCGLFAIQAATGPESARKEALEQIVSQFSRLAYRCAQVTARRKLVGFTRDDVDELAQEIQSWWLVELPRWTPAVPFCGWLMIIGSRRADWYTRRYLIRRAVAQLPETVPQDELPPATRASVRDLIRQLPEKRRRAFEMVVFERRSILDVEAEMGLGKSILYLWIADIRRAIVDCLSNEP